MLQKPDELRHMVLDAGQSHVFDWWDDLNSEARQQLVDQLKSIDFEWVKQARDRILSPVQTSQAPPQLSPVTPIPIPRTQEALRQAQEAKERGEAIIKEGKMAAFVVAGGQGTRLGYPGPKGEFPIGPISQKPFFQLFAEKIIVSSRKFNVTIPWIIMTSEATHDETVAFFKKHDFFYLNPDDCFFVQQGMLPSLDEHGRLVLDSKHHVHMSPNGHGGTFSALSDSGVLAELESRGIRTLSYFQVDNPLVRIIDPVFIGYHVQQNSKMSSKMVRKAYAEEKVGILGLLNGKLKVIEYSNMTDDEIHLRRPDGSLQYDAANIAIHLIETEFVHTIVTNKISLPYHMAHKAVPILDHNGLVVKPNKPNAYKFEMFVFDALSYQETSVIMEVNRHEEFSPVKNKQGKDSPQTARADMIRYFGNWLERAGYTLPKDSEGHITIPIEIGPFYADNQIDFLNKVPKNMSISQSIYLDEK